MSGECEGCNEHSIECKCDGVHVVNSGCDTVTVSALWISVKDSLPELDEQVLACTKDNVEKAFRTQMGAEVIWTHCDFIEWHDVTHWMPLPKPPKETDGMD